MKYIYIYIYLIYLSVSQNDEKLDTCIVYLHITCLFTIPQKENNKEKYIKN